MYQKNRGKPNMEAGAEAPLDSLILKRLYSLVKCPCVATGHIVL